MKRLNGSKILVTGTSGFIGSRLATKLLGLNAKVYGISRKSQKNIKDIYWYQGDLSDINFVEEVISEIKPDYIFHLASHVLGSRDVEYVNSTLKANLISTVNILMTVESYPCKRLIITGSMEEGDSNMPDNIPSSPYAAAKMAAANYARMFYRLYNTPVSIASLYMVYGPGQVDLSKLVPFVILKALDGELPNISTGVRKIDWIYVDDVVEGLIQMLVSNNIDGKTIDIGSGKLISIKEFVTNLLELIDPELIALFGSKEDRPFEQEKMANIKETKNLIGWNSKTKLKDGLMKTIEYYSK